MAGREGVSFDPKDTIPILLIKSKSVFVPKKFQLEDITEKDCARMGKDIQTLCLLVGHSELNPIELIWTQVKSKMARKNTTFRIQDVQALVCEALKKCHKRKLGKQYNT